MVTFLIFTFPCFIFDIKKKKKKTEVVLLTACLIPLCALSDTVAVMCSKQLTIKNPQLLR